MTSTTRYTAQQARAIQSRGVSIALSAGAGCGKTFVLTERFLSHLDPEGENVPLHKLVAITFTDRAAREMRDRIRSACRRKLESCSPDSASRWLKILYDLDSARITTIHSFCTSLLRAHAVEAGLDPRFTVSDATQTDAYRHRSARDTLHRLLEQHDQGAHVLVLHFGLETAKQHLADMIGQRFRASVAAFANLSAEQCQHAWERSWQEQIVPACVRQLLDNPLLEKTRAWLGSHVPKKTSVLYERCRLALGLLTRPPTPESNSLPWLEELREQLNLRGNKADIWDSGDAAEEIKLLFSALREAIDTCREGMVYEPADLPHAAELTVHFSRIAGAAIADYADGKQREARLDFDDLLLSARDLLRQSPRVARQLADGIELLMVDEFQDTDPVQAEIIRALVGPALKTGKLFLVGDVQQSIYRFRRAEPQLFQQLQDEIPQAGRIPLDVNFRSQPEILNFVNHLFAGQLGENYRPLKPFPDEQRSPPPTVEFLWATSDEFGQPSPQDKPSADELRTWEAGWIALRIQELLADSAPSVRDRHRRDATGQPLLRRAERGDIVLLFRTLGNAAVYEAALAKYGIDYYLVGGKTFFAQQEVFDLLNLCRWLENPADEIALVGCLRSPFFSASDDAIHALSMTDPSLNLALARPVPSWLDETDRRCLQFASRVLSELRVLKDRVPPSELLKSAIARTGYDASLLHEYLGSRKVANLEKLIRRSQEFDDAEHFTLSDYVRELEQAVEDQADEALAATLPETGNVVRLMTIHQSKGLEFPVVILADMNRRGNHRSSGIIVHPEWGVMINPPEEFGSRREHLGVRIHQTLESEADAAELKRLLYVATTRAADRLILSAGLKDVFADRSPWLTTLAARYDLREGRLKTDYLFGSGTGAGADSRRIPEIRPHWHPPPLQTQREPQPQRVPLRELPELLALPPDEAFPDSTARFSPDLSQLGLVSVSTLEQFVPEHHPAWYGAEQEQDELDEQPKVAADVLGTIVHHVLQHLDVHAADRWPEILARVLQAERLSAAQQAAVQAQAGTLIQRILSHALWGRMSSANILHRELDFLLQWPLSDASDPGNRPEPAVILTGQIDVLLQDADGWQVFDYKTGNFPVTVPDDQLLAPYVLQLGVYALAAERQLQQPLSSIGLITLRPDVRVISFPWTIEMRARVMQQVDAALQTLREHWKNS